MILLFGAKSILVKATRRCVVVAEIKAPTASFGGDAMIP